MKIIEKLVELSQQAYFAEFSKARDYDAACVARIQAVADAVMPRWIRVSELPEKLRPCVLINMDKWEDYEMGINITATGYLNQHGAFPFWSCRGERAQSVEAFTHWMYLNHAPKEETNLT